MRRRYSPALSFPVALVLLVIAWAMAVPLGTAQDEDAHYFKALGTGRGELVGLSFLSWSLSLCTEPRSLSNGGSIIALAKLHGAADFAYNNGTPTWRDARRSLLASVSERTRRAHAPTPGGAEATSPI
jgi:hypothetical protein